MEETARNSARSSKMPPTLGREEHLAEGTGLLFLRRGHPKLMGNLPGQVGTRAPSTERSHGGRAAIPRVPCHLPPCWHVPRARQGQVAFADAAASVRSRFPAPQACALPAGRPATAPQGFGTPPLLPPLQG